MAKRTTQTRRARLDKALARARRAHAQLTAATAEFPQVRQAMNGMERSEAAHDLGYYDLHDAIENLDS